MKIAIIGTGKVGRGLAARLASLGHAVVIGTRNPADTMARTAALDGNDTSPFANWQHDNPAIRLVTLPEAGVQERSSSTLPMGNMSWPHSRASVRNGSLEKYCWI